MKRMILITVLAMTAFGCDQKQECLQGQISCGGTCATTRSDPNNCGACGAACAGNQVCQSGQCASACQAGFTACGRACVALGGDDQNCQACGKACPVGQHCGDGCFSCAANETYCFDPSGFGGSCSDLVTDNLNCGTCGNRCGLKQRCTAGACL